MTRQLSWHYSLDDLCRSDLAVRHGIDNTPSAVEVQNLKILAERILEPIWGWCGPLYLSSGYRCLALNRLLGSKDTSAHVQGLAADLVCLQDPHRDPLGFAQFLSRTKTLGFDQLIHEYGRWIHVSAPKAGTVPRKQLLTIDHQGVREGLLPARPKLPKEKVA